MSANPVISEIMADNRTTLLDEDGDASDWIEIYNPGTSAIDLEGWHLTDKADRLTQWEFPALELDAGRSLIVFASGKDRDRVGGSLHTNFKLSTDGEYLGLVAPDGRTIVSQFDPFPAQYTDVSYGPEQTLVQTSLVQPTSSSRLLTPTSSASDVPSAVWTQPQFNDAAWRNTQAAIGHDLSRLDGDYRPLIAASGGTDAMVGQTASAYLRSVFQINGQVPRVESLNLDLNFDDGFVAYLNGVEVSQQNAPGTLAWNSTATRSHGGLIDAVQYPTFSDLDDQDDFTLVGAASWQANRLQLTPATADQSGAAWLTRTVSFSPGYSFRASMVINAHSPGGTFDPDGRGGEGMTFVLQTGGNRQLGGSGGQLGLDSTGMTFLAVEFDTGNTGSFDPDDTMATHVGIDTSAQGSLARVKVPRFNGSVTTIGQPGPGIDLRYVWIEYDGPTDTLEVYFAATDQQPATPTVSAQVDLDQLFGGVTDLWTGWTAGTGSAYNAHDVRSFALTTGAGQLGLDAVRIDLTHRADLLQSGQNVLAIHGLNVAAADDDFLLRPSLQADVLNTGPQRYFSRPTPGRVNGLGDEPPTGAVMFSANTRTFVSPFDLVLTPPSAQATIRYTTNGALPTETSTLYTGPMRISGSVRIRARAFQPDKGPGPVHSESFLQVDSSLTSFEQGRAFESNLPLMIFDSFNKNVDSQDTNLVPVSAIFVNPGADGRAGILEAAEFGGRGGMRIRGQTSQGFPKKQYALELWDELNSDVNIIPADQAPDKSAAFFGLPAESDWVLNGPYSDKSQLENYLSFLWSNKAGSYAPRGTLVEVFLNQNGGALNFRGDYLGTYVLLEKIKRDDERVDITELTPLDNQSPEISGGYIWKKDKPGAGDVPFYTSGGQEVRMVEPEDGVITTQQKEWLRNYLNQFEAALYGPDFADPERGYQQYIDVDSWVETWLLVELTKNIDGFRLSTFYHKDRNGKIKQGPAWDYNLSLANANYLGGAYPEGWYSSNIGGGDYPYWGRLFQDPSFQQRVIDRWNELRQTVWSTPALLADIDQAVGRLSDGNPRLERPAAGERSNPLSRNFDKWGTLTSYVWPNCFFGQGDCPASPLPGGGSPQRYGDYVYIMKDFVQRRTAWMDAQFPAGPRLAPASGVVPKPTQVTLDVPAGWTAYYTTDGMDPLRPVATAPEVRLFPAGANAQSLVPSNSQLIDACKGVSLVNPANCFMNPDYVLGRLSENWTIGRLGVGFEQQTGYESYIRTDVVAQMYGVTGSVYIRVPFQATSEQVAAATQMKLRVRYDDGFVAYLWSSSANRPVEIARVNAPGVGPTTPIDALAYDANATTNHADGDAVQLIDFDVTATLPYLRAGQNMLIVQGLNSSNTSSDFLIDTELVLTGSVVDLPGDVTKYTGPITIDHNTQVTARLFHPTRRVWSGKTAATYLTEMPQLVISEVNYHPYAPTTQELAQSPLLEQEDFEFIELKNIGSQPAYLVGMEFVEGVEYAFGSDRVDPGQHGVLVKNRAAFALRYGNAVPVLGEFTDGSLNNGGETLRLEDAAGRVVFEMTYADSALWPARADGSGGSLQLVDPEQTPVDQYSKSYRWRGSTETGGSPGTAGQPVIPVVVNEVLSHTDSPITDPDSVELLNTGTSAIDIGGWYLSDAASQPFKYRIPDGTRLQPGQYVVFDETHFNPTPLTPAPHHFSLNGAQGDDVWLTIAGSNGAVLSFVDDVHFPATANGESLGRVPNGRGVLAPQQFVTLGSANAAPRVGPLMISEVQYHPGAPSEAALAQAPDVTVDDLEFVEIVNPTAQAVSLREWRIRGGIDYDFADAAQLAAGQSLVVVSFDPLSAAGAALLRAFRTQYGLDASVTILGPYGGKLADGDERVVLQRPDEPPLDDPTTIPRLPEDEVIYDNLPPWPADADGRGASLQRVAADAHGNLPVSWQAESPSPGRFDGRVNLAGDFNGDGIVNDVDIDLLSFQIRQPAPNPAYDLNGDRKVDALDRDHLIRSILNSTYGDSNLDQLFTSQDFIVVFQAGKYEDDIIGNGSWAEGDWSGDGDFDSNDMILAFQMGAYSAAAKPPESR